MFNWFKDESHFHPTPQLPFPSFSFFFFSFLFFSSLYFLLPFLFFLFFSFLFFTFFRINGETDLDVDKRHSGFDSFYLIRFLFVKRKKNQKKKKIGFCQNLFYQKKGEGSSARNSSARKNCSTPKSRLLNTVRADDKNIWICSKIKKVCRTCLVEQMQVLDQNVQLLE